MRLCNEYLHVKAQHVLDPTMLMDVDDYQKLIAERKTTSYANTLSSYILDSSDEIKSVLQSLSVEKKLPWRDLFKDYLVPPSFCPMATCLLGSHDDSYRFFPWHGLLHLVQQAVCGLG